jgi:hypothetical protein
MKCMVDIPHELILLAAADINKKQDICDILPTARFSMPSTSNDFKYTGLVCDPGMGGKQTGVSATHCRNCVLDKEKTALRKTNSAKPKPSKRIKKAK